MTVTIKIDIDGEEQTIRADSIGVEMYENDGTRTTYLVEDGNVSIGEGGNGTVGGDYGLAVEPSPF